MPTPVQNHSPSRRGKYPEHEDGTTEHRVSPAPCAMAHRLAPCSAAILARESSPVTLKPPPSLKLHIPHPSALILSLCQNHRRTFSFSSTSGTRQHLWFKKKCEYSAAISYVLSPKSRARGKCVIALRAELLSSNGCLGFKMPAEGENFYMRRQNELHPFTRRADAHFGWFMNFKYLLAMKGSLVL